MPGTVMLEGSEPTPLSPKAFQDARGKTFGSPHSVQSPFARVSEPVARHVAFEKKKTGD